MSALQLEDSAKYSCAVSELTVLEVMGKAVQKMFYSCYNFIKHRQWNTFRKSEGLICYCLILK